MDVAVSDEIRFSNVYRRNDNGESFSFEGYDFWLRGFSTMKICTGRKGGGGGQNPWKLACRISRWRSFRSSYGEFLLGEWYLINCSIIFQILKDVSVFFFFRESRFFDSCDFLQEEWRSWELGYRVFWSSRSTIVKSSSSVFVWVWSFERWYFVTCSIVFRILENVTFDGLHYCTPSFAFSFYKDSHSCVKVSAFPCIILYISTR